MILEDCAVYFKSDSRYFPLPPGKIVYVAGPMRGIPLFNEPAFRERSELLRDQGLVVINPAESFGGDVTLDWTQYMKMDILYLFQVDALSLLDGWEKSRGACVEVIVASTLGIPCYYLHYGEWLPVDSTLLLESLPSLFS